GTRSGITRATRTSSSSDLTRQKSRVPFHPPGAEGNPPARQGWEGVNREAGGCPERPEQRRRPGGLEVPELVSSGPPSCAGLRILLLVGRLRPPGPDAGPAAYAPLGPGRPAAFPPSCPPARRSASRRNARRVFRRTTTPNRGLTSHRSNHRASGPWP